MKITSLMTAAGGCLVSMVNSAGFAGEHDRTLAG
jgi:hypothetical protein